MPRNGTMDCSFFLHDQPACCWHDAVRTCHFVCRSMYLLEMTPKRKEKIPGVYKFGSEVSVFFPFLVKKKTLRYNCINIIISKACTVSFAS
jgi:hypothetical protein